MAFLPESEVQEMLQRNPTIRKTPKTITQRKHFLEHLASVREQAVAVDLEENLSGVICVTSRIFDQAGRAVAGLSISSPSSRMEPKVAQVQRALREPSLMVPRMLSPSSSAADVVSLYRRPSSPSLARA